MHYINRPISVAGLICGNIHNVKIIIVLHISSFGSSRTNHFILSESTDKKMRSKNGLGLMANPKRIGGKGV